MIKISAINSIAKKAALGVMLASSVSVASNPIKTEIASPNHTEVVSKEGTDALRALTYPMLQQHKQSVPTTHNKALDEKLLKFANNSEEKIMINEYLDNIYKESGSYLGSAEIQQSIDYNMFLAFLDGNIEILKKFDENAYNKIDKEAMKKVKEKGEPIKQWLNENYHKVYNQPFGQFDHPPDAEEVINALDNYVRTNKNNLFDKRMITSTYDFLNTIFKRELDNTNKNTIKKQSDYIAFQVSNADYLLFYNLLQSAGLDIKNQENKIDSNLSEFLYAVKPKSNQ